MASQIDPTIPVAGTPTTESVRSNFLTARNEISTLQTQTEGSPFLRLAGGRMSGPMYLFNDPTDAMMPATKGYVDAGGGGDGGGGIPEAPVTGQIFGRGDGAWVPVLPIAGGRLTGSLVIGDAVPDLAAPSLLVESLGAGEVLLNAYSRDGGGFAYRSDGAAGCLNTDPTQGLLLRAAAAGAEGAPVTFGVPFKFDANGRMALEGPLALTPASADAAIILDRAAGDLAALRAQTGGVERWRLVLADGAAESAGNAGSNLQFMRYSDTGTLVDVPLSINRATGRTGLGNGTAVNDPLEIAVATGSTARARFTVGTTRTWLGGVAANGSFIIRDDTLGADRITIAGNGVTSISGAVTFGSTVTLNANATVNLHAVPLQQLNSNLANYLPLAGGGTIGGPLTLDGASASLTLVNTIGTALIDLSGSGANSSALIQFPGGSQIVSNSSYFSIGLSGVWNSATSWRITWDRNNGLLSYHNGDNLQLLAMDSIGNMTINGALTQGSDETKKKNVAPILQGLALIKQLQPKSFQWADSADESEHWGFLAQDVQPVIPAAVKSNGDMIGIEEMGILAAAVAAIKELAAIVETK